MNSLRSRLILGSFLVAVVPLALAMFLLARRIESMVREDAGKRLEAALGGLEAQIVSDGERITGNMNALGIDPVLKRLYLLEPAGSIDLSEYLAERRSLLGLDFLRVADTTGHVVADGSLARSAGASQQPHAEPVEPVEPHEGNALAIERLDDGSGLALAATAPILYENQTAGRVQGGRVFDAGFLERLERTSGLELVLRTDDGRAVAATVPGADRAPVPPAQRIERVELAGRSYLSRTFPLAIGPGQEARITGLVSTEPADQTIRTLQLTSVLLGAVGLAIAILLGVLWSSQVSRPVEELAAFSRKLAQGEWDEPLTLHSVRELETLVEALDRMRRELKTYRDKLVTTERQAAWSQMARKVAHEIKNPLTPIAISVADLKRSFDQKRPEFPQILDQAVRTIGEEVETLKRLLEEFSEFGRFPPPQLATCRLPDLLSDLEALYGRDVTEGRFAIARPVPDVAFRADASQIRRALVNLIKNGLEAVDGDGRVVVSARTEPNVLEIAISDTGPGLSADQRAHLFVPGFTTKRKGSGLGLTIVERIVSDHHGTIGVDPAAERGTTFRIRLPREA